MAADPASPQWHVYVVRCVDATLYTGVAKNLQARIAQHNAGRGAKYTNSRRPVTLVYQEEVADRSAAQSREYEIRRLAPQAKRALIAR